jgi:hypothetical protein
MYSDNVVLEPADLWNSAALLGSGPRSDRHTSLGLDGATQGVLKTLEGSVDNESWSRSRGSGMRLMKGIARVSLERYKSGRA